MQLLEKSGFESKELKLSSLKQFDLSSHPFVLAFAFHLIPSCLLLMYWSAPFICVSLDFVLAYLSPLESQVLTADTHHSKPKMP